MDEMLGRLSSFSITEEEASVIGIPDDGSVMSTMIKLWSAEGDLFAQVIDRDIFLFSFKKEQDRARVLAMESWSFNKSLILLKVVNGDETLRWDSWSLMCFWIRVYNLPYDGMIREIGEKIGNGIGRFLDVVTDKNGRCPGMYMCLRVQINVSKPLRQGAMVQLGSNGAKVWTSFKYKRVPDFCFGCARIGHGRFECVDDKVRNVNTSDQLSYSSELRVDIRSERSLGPGNAGGGRWKGSSGRSEQFPGSGNVGGVPRENNSCQSDWQGGTSPYANHEFEGAGFNDGIALADDVYLSSHLREFFFSKARGCLAKLGEHAGTVHVEKRAADGLVFLAGVVEPVKRSIGKWKKEAQLKGASGVGSSSVTNSENVKRKMVVELVAGEVTKLRKTYGFSSVAADLAEAVVQPHQIQ
ncbi:hypothetical protein TIFTF001_032294 [Ficus carica]|uniref:DUF4283 domain-containing protein n=1 Tax=Ficus carica TaxID=3494 RepID=A0AA88DWE6_FICCA|nr:hypothetical protein TIFTF001_032294 [Ficus carica]